MKIELNSIEKLQETITKQAQENSVKKDKIDVQQIEITAQKKAIDNLQAEIKELKEKIDYLIRQQFSSKSEKFDSNQPSLFTVDDNEESIPAEEDEEIEITFKRKKGGRTSPPKDLPRVRVEHDISDEDKICNCGDTMHRMKEIVSEQYDIVPAKFQIIVSI